MASLRVRLVVMSAHVFKERELSDYGKGVTSGIHFYHQQGRFRA